MISYQKLGLTAQRGEVLKLRKACLTAARQQAPKKTGNLRMNGIYSRATKYGFDIVWDTSFVYYLQLVDQGKVRIKQNKSGSLNKRSNSRVEKNKGFVQRGMNAVMCCVGEFQKDTKESKENIYKLARKTSSAKLTPIMFKKDFDLKAQENKNIKRLYDKVVSCVKYTARHEDEIKRVENETTLFSNVKYNKTGKTGRQVEIVSNAEYFDVFEKILRGDENG